MEDFRRLMRKALLLALVVLVLSGITELIVRWASPDRAGIGFAAGVTFAVAAMMLRLAWSLRQYGRALEREEVEGSRPQGIK